MCGRISSAINDETVLKRMNEQRVGKMNNLNNQGMHPEDKNNLFLFMILALLIYFGFDHFILKPKMEALRATQQAEEIEKQKEFEANREASADYRPVEDTMSREDILAENPRLNVRNEHVLGTISLKGGRFDDLRLRNHFVSLEHEDQVSVLSPPGTEDARYAEYGWVPANKNIKVPGRDAVWMVRGGSGQALTPENSVTLYWDNGQGVIFERVLSLDEHFLITVEDRIINQTDEAMVFYPYGLISQRGVPADFTGRWIMHEGPIGYVGKELMEVPYDDLDKEGNVEAYSEAGWIGITEKYWFVSLLPPQDGPKTFRFIEKDAMDPEADPLYQVDLLGQAYTVDPGESISYQNRLFAGTKRVQLLDAYEKELGVRHFDLSVDFGMWYFLTKPFYYLLMYLNTLVGNFGITIIIFTIMLRAAVFPLANTSYRSFAKMRTISPQMAEMREKYGDDKQKLQAALVELYQKEQVNPMAGCLPILIQIPIFFSLYKVLSLTIEMRHAPFFGWVQDLSAPDPTTIFNLFGLIAWQPPQALMIGIWPCLMLMVMLAQRSMSPPPQDKTQAMMVYYMPWFLTFIMAKFAAGLVIYWTFSAMFAGIQQYVIMSSMGVKVKFFGKSLEDRLMRKKVMEGPNIHPEAEVIEDEIEEAVFGQHEEQPQKPVTPPKPKKKKKKK